MRVYTKVSEGDQSAVVLRHAMYEREGGGPHFLESYLQRGEEQGGML